MSIKHRVITAAVCTIATLSAWADGTVTNAELGVSVYLPDNWIAEAEGDSALYLTDTTFTYRSQVVIKKHTINTADYSTAGDWTRSHLLAYMLVVQYSYDPFGAVLYFDSSKTALQDSLWAPEAFSEFYSLDSNLDSWNEYIRYTETGSIGYELYAIGDTADMKANIGMYMGLIKLVKIEKKTGVSTKSVFRRGPNSSIVSTPATMESGTFSLLGRRIAAERHIRNGVYYTRERGALHVKVQ